MNLLALDSSTETFSVALQCPGGPVLERHGAGAAQASTALIPAILGLLAQATLPLTALHAIVVGRGPGSFTGLRTACAVAQGLAFGSGVPVLAVDTLLAVAEEARARCGATQIIAVLDARMDEVYSAAYAWGGDGWVQHGGFQLGPPEAIVVPTGWTLAGNALGPYGGRLVGAARVTAQPNAAALLRLSPLLLAAGRAGPASNAVPLYIRDKVAQTTAERAAARALATLA